MPTREPNMRLAAVMRLASSTNSGLAKRVVAIAAEHGVVLKHTHVNVKRWLDGVQPDGMTPYFIAEALGRKLGRPVPLPEIGLAHRDSGALVSAARYPEHLASSVGALAALVRTDLADEAVDGVRDLDPAAWSETMVRWLVTPDLAGANQSATIVASPVNALVRTTALFAELDYQFGGGYARPSLVEFVKTEVTPLLNGPQARDPDLLRAAAAVLRLAGWTSYDTGRFGLGQRYLTQALRLAQAAGDRALGGRILAGMSHLANFRGYANDAINLARAAQTGARDHATPTAMALFHAMEARALANRGDRRDCERALTEAERWFAHRVADQDPIWLRYFDQAELAAEFAHSYRDLGVASKAIEYAKLAVDQHEPLYARSILFCRTVLATGYLGQGDIEQGLAHAEQAAQASGALRSGRCVAYLHDFMARLTPFRKHKPVAEFVERVGSALPARI
jgi:tetratricopeptide (TPR) repeat protein